LVTTVAQTKMISIRQSLSHIMGYVRDDMERHPKPWRPGLEHRTCQVVWVQEMIDTVALADPEPGPLHRLADRHC
ncbi:MAG: hypothetical protein AAFX99_26655, partial [Myxococcota bacterium]